MRRLVLVALFVVVGFGALISRGFSEPPNKVDTFMKAKLMHSKNVLEGLATEDYKLIAKNAQDLALLSQAATWNVLQTEEYLRNSNEFRRAANAIKKAADNKNLDGATLAYMQMTMNCVTCHKYVRTAGK